MSKFLILVDYKNDFLLSIEDLSNYKSMNIQRIRDQLELYGHSVKILKFNELDFSSQYKGCFIIYQSAEDNGVFYKDYLEDIIYFLEMQGAILLPSYFLLLAHHNKNFMELLRYRFTNENLKTIKSKVYGSAEEAIENKHDFPVILKSSEGSGSYRVFLAKNKNEFAKIAKNLSGVFIVNNLKSLKEFIVYRISLSLFKKVQTRFRAYTFFRKKFIVQNFIKNLKGDYKVLYFGGKYYPIFRENRKNDFRASGSGLLVEVNENEIHQLLDFARSLTLELEFPVIGMDIGFDGNIFHLFEFQCIHIGPYALQASNFWFEFIDGNWLKFIGKSILEDEYCRSLNGYIQKYYDHHE